MPKDAKGGEDSAEHAEVKIQNFPLGAQTLAVPCCQTNLGLRSQTHLYLTLSAELKDRETMRRRLGAHPRVQTRRQIARAYAFTRRLRMAVGV